MFFGFQLSSIIFFPKKMFTSYKMDNILGRSLFFFLGQEITIVS